MLDIVLLSVPYSNITVPPLGIAVLNGVLLSHGYKSKCVDLSMQLNKQCDIDGKDFEPTQWSLVVPNPDTVDYLNNYFDKQADAVLALQPRFIGISVFSYMAHMATFKLCKIIKQKNEKVKIVVGGPGVGTLLTSDFERCVPVGAVEKFFKFGEFLEKRHMTDYVIYGDGEESLLDLLQNQTDYQDKDYKIFDYTQEFPFANFDDFVLSDYKGNLGKNYSQIPVFTSKGCVRNCDFCDVNVVQKKFRFRQGKAVVKELLYLAERYGIRDFNFVDSLVNGSLSSMMAWIQELADYNRANPDKKITWSGSWICRPQGQMKEHVYQLMAESGCTALAVGAESGSNTVLAAMDKKTNVEALFYEAEQFRKNNIGFLTLLIVGHWSERWEDFVATLKMLYRLCDYVRSGHYIAVSIGFTMNVTKNTPMEVNARHNALEYVSAFVWWTKLNPSLTAKDRYFRLLIIEKFCQVYNLPIMEPVLQGVYEILHKEFDTIKNFYTEKYQTHRVTEPQLAEYYYENFDQLLPLIEDETDTDLYIDIALQSHAVNGLARLQILHNNQLLFDSEIPEGLQHIRVGAQQQNHNLLQFRLQGKNQFDTLVNEHGQIIKDKCLVFDKLIINGIDLIADPEFFLQNVVCLEDGKTSQAKFGLYKNLDEIQIEYSGLFKPWYNKKTKLNRILTAQITSEMTKPRTNTDDYFRTKIYELIKSLPC